MPQTAKLKSMSIIRSTRRAPSGGKSGKIRTHKEYDSAGETMEALDSAKSQKTKLKRGAYRGGFEALFEHSPMPTFLIDADGVIIAANRAATKRAAGDAKFAGKSALAIVKNGYKKKLRDTIAKCRSSVRPQKAGIAVDTAEDSECYATARVIPASNSDAKTGEVIIVIEDVSRLYSAEKKYERLYAELEEKIAARTAALEQTADRLYAENLARQAAEKLLRVTKDKIAESYRVEKELNAQKSKLIQSINYQYRTPLTLIRGSIDLIERLNKSGKKDKIDYYVQTIKSAVADMTQRLENADLVSEIDSEGKYLTPSQFDLISLAKDIIDEMNVSGAENIIDIIARSNSIRVFSDKKSYAEIIKHLLRNAVDYSFKGRRIKFEIAKRNDNIILKVENEGIGVPPEDGELIFKPFYRGRNVSEKPGIGVGLSLAKKFARGLGGELTFESKPNKKTIFTAILPQ